MVGLYKMVGLYQNDLFFLDVSIYFPKNVESNNSQGMAEMPGNP
jgi:hypothetical protein